MPRKVTKFISLLLCFSFFIQQAGFAQIAGELDISGHIAQLRASLIQDKFRPLHLRYLSYDHLNNSFNLLLDKGDLNHLKKPAVEDTTKTLLNYFFVGISLPNDSFWVNLRPDSEDRIIDNDLAKTDVGKILLEADLQLKKDTANATSPQTSEGKEYWDKLYKKAGELFGSDNLTIPTLTRPWIVPGEIIIRETESNAYVYKATLKVMLEQDYLKDSNLYSFKDDRLKALNEYSSQLIRELIIPKLTKEINTAKRYAPLRQVYYSLIIAQWFKSRFYGKGGLYSYLIDKKNLTGLVSQAPWSKTTYFKEYQKSFKQGEYNLKIPVSGSFGQTIRSYMSGGMNLNVNLFEGNNLLAPGQSKTFSSLTTILTLLNPPDSSPLSKSITGQGVKAYVEIPKDLAHPFTFTPIVEALPEAVTEESLSSPSAGAGAASIAQPVIVTGRPGWFNMAVDWLLGIGKKTLSAEKKQELSELEAEIQKNKYKVIGGLADALQRDDLEKFTGKGAIALDPLVYDPRANLRLSFLFAENVKDTVSTVAKQLRRLNKNHIRVLVLGTGAGLDALTAYYQSKKANLTINLDAIDIQPEAKDNTKFNFDLLFPGSITNGEVRVLQVTEEQEFNGLSGQYDLVIFNAPDTVDFVQDSAFKTAKMPKHVFDNLMAQAKERLATDGLVLLSASRRSVKEMYADTAVEVITNKDAKNLDRRIVSLRNKGRAPLSAPSLQKIDSIMEPSAVSSPVKNQDETRSIDQESTSGEIKASGNIRFGWKKTLAVVFALFVASMSFLELQGKYIQNYYYSIKEADFKRSGRLYLDEDKMDLFWKAEMAKGAEKAEIYKQLLYDNDFNVRFIAMQKLMKLSETQEAVSLLKDMLMKEDDRTARWHLVTVIADILGKEKAAGILKGVFNDEGLIAYDRMTAAGLLLQLFVSQPELADELSCRNMFKLIDKMHYVADGLSKIVSKRQDLRDMFLPLINNAAEKFSDPSLVSPDDFNTVVFALTLDNLTQSEALKCKLVKTLFDFAINAKEQEKKILYSFSIMGGVAKMSDGEKIFLDRQYPEIVSNLNALNQAESLPYKEIFGRKNPNKELNIRAYIPLQAEVYKNMFVGDLKLTEQGEGERTVFTGMVNGKKVTIYLDTSGDPKNYQVRIFQDMANEKVPTIVYSGHTGMGGTLSPALSEAPELDYLQSGTKCIIILSCASAQSYLGEIKKRYPYSQGVYTTTTSFNTSDVPALKEIILGMTKEQIWPQIEEGVKKAMPQGKNKVNYLFPHQSQLEIFNLGQRGFYIPTSGIIVLEENASFAFQPGNVAAESIVSNKPTEVIQKAQYFFRWNDVLKRVSDSIEAGGFMRPAADEQDVFFVSKEDGKYKVSLNLGYRNSSKAALTMMLLYELNQYFSKSNNKNGEVTVFDRIRGLQLVAEFAKTHHKEHLFPDFLAKYGYEAGKTPFKLLEKTLEHNDADARAKALQELLKNLGSPAEPTAADFKSQGLLSYDTDLRQMGQPIASVSSPSQQTVNSSIGAQVLRSLVNTWQFYNYYSGRLVGKNVPQRFGCVTLEKHKNAGEKVLRVHLMDLRFGYEREKKRAEVEQDLDAFFASLPAVAGEFKKMGYDRFELVTGHPGLLRRFEAKGFRAPKEGEPISLSKLDRLWFNINMKAGQIFGVFAEANLIPTQVMYLPFTDVTTQALQNEIDWYLGLKLPLPSREQSSDNRLKGYSHSRLAGFKESAVKAVDNKENGLTYYDVAESEAVVVKDLKPNERLITDDLRSCVGVAFYANTGADSYYGLGHLYFISDLIGFKALNAQTDDFVSLLPEQKNIQKLKVMLYYNLDEKYIEFKEGKERLIASLRQAIGKALPGASVEFIEKARNGEPYPAALAVSPEGWMFIRRDYNKGLQRWDSVHDEDNFGVWAEDAAGSPVTRREFLGQLGRIVLAALTYDIILYVGDGTALANRPKDIKTVEKNIPESALNRGAVAGARTELIGFIENDKDTQYPQHDGEKLSDALQKAQFSVDRTVYEYYDKNGQLVGTAHNDGTIDDAGNIVVHARHLLKEEIATPEGQHRLKSIMTHEAVHLLFRGASDEAIETNLQALRSQFSAMGMDIAPLAKSIEANVFARTENLLQQGEITKAAQARLVKEEQLAHFTDVLYQISSIKAMARADNAASKRITGVMDNFIKTNSQPQDDRNGNAIYVESYKLILRYLDQQGKAELISGNRIESQKTELSSPALQSGFGFLEIEEIRLKAREVPSDLRRSVCFDAVLTILNRLAPGWFDRLRIWFFVKRGNLSSLGQLAKPLIKKLNVTDTIKDDVSRAVDFILNPDTAFKYFSEDAEPVRGVGKYCLGFANQASKEILFSNSFLDKDSILGQSSILAEALLWMTLESEQAFPGPISRAVYVNSLMEKLFNPSQLRGAIREYVLSEVELRADAAGVPAAPLPTPTPEAPDTNSAPEEAIDEKDIIDTHQTLDAGGLERWPPWRVVIDIAQNHVDETRNRMAELYEEGNHDAAKQIKAGLYLVLKDSSKVTFAEAKARGLSHTDIKEIVFFDEGDGYDVKMLQYRLSHGKKTAKFSSAKLAAFESLGIDLPGGQFGEGQKMLAAAILTTRSQQESQGFPEAVRVGLVYKSQNWEAALFGRPVEIKNKKRTITTRSVAFKSIVQEPSIQGSQTIIVNPTKKIFDAVMDTDNLVLDFSPDAKVVAQSRNGRAFEHGDDREPNIYVRGYKVTSIRGFLQHIQNVYIQRILFNYSLNEAEINRDRDQLSAEILAEIGKILLALTDKEVIKRIIKAVAESKERYTCNRGYATSDSQKIFESLALEKAWGKPANQAVWKEAFYELYGDDAMLASSSDFQSNSSRQAMEAGEKLVALNYTLFRLFKDIGIKTDLTYSRESLDEFKLQLSLDYRQERWGTLRIALDFLQNHADAVRESNDSAQQQEKAHARVEFKIKGDSAWKDWAEFSQYDNEQIVAIRFRDTTENGYDQEYLRHFGSDKSTSASQQVGQFGEGLKLATAACIRLGFDVTLRSRAWLAEAFKYKVYIDKGKGQRNEYDRLGFKLYKNEQEAGSETIIACPEDKPDARQHFNELIDVVRGIKTMVLRHQEVGLAAENPQPLESTEAGDVVSLEQGTIYVKDFLLTSEEKERLLLSYNFKSLTINPDRDIPSNNDLRAAVGAILSRIASKELIKSIITAAARSPHGKYHEFQDLSQLESFDAQAWVGVFRQMFGENAVLKSELSSAEIEAKFIEYKVVHMNQEIASALWANGKGIPFDVEVIHPQIEFLDPGQLTDREQGLLDLARLLDEEQALFPHANARTIDYRVFEKATNSRGATMGVAGVQSGNVIGFNRSMFTNPVKFFEIYVEEIAHLISGASDGTREHFNEVSAAMVWMVQNLQTARAREAIDKVFPGFQVNRLKVVTQEDGIPEVVDSEEMSSPSQQAQSASSPIGVQETSSPATQKVAIFESRAQMRQGLLKRFIPEALTQLKGFERGRDGLAKELLGLVDGIYRDMGDKDEVPDGAPSLQDYHGEWHNLDTAYIMLRLLQQLGLSGGDSAIGFIAALLHDFHVRPLIDAQGKATASDVKTTVRQLMDLFGITEYVLPDEEMRQGFTPDDTYTKFVTESRKTEARRLFAALFGEEKIISAFKEIAAMIRRSDYPSDAPLPAVPRSGEYKEDARQIRKNIEQRLKNDTSDSALDGLVEETKKAFFDLRGKINAEESFKDKKAQAVQWYERVETIETAYLAALRQVAVGRRQLIHDLAVFLEKVADQAGFYVLGEAAMVERDVVGGLSKENGLVSAWGTFPYFILEELLVDWVLERMERLPAGYKINFIRNTDHFANRTQEHAAALKDNDPLKPGLQASVEKWSAIRNSVIKQLGLSVDDVSTFSSPVKTVRFVDHPLDHEGSYSKEASHNLRELLEATGLQEGTVLNIGYGRNPLKADGYNVINVDQLQHFGIENTDFRTFHHDFFAQDFLDELPLQNKPEAVLFYNMWTYMHIYGARETARESVLRYLSRAKEIVAPGGKILFVYFMPPEAEASFDVISEVEKIAQEELGIMDAVVFRNEKDGSSVALSITVPLDASSPIEATSANAIKTIISLENILNGNNLAAGDRDRSMAAISLGYIYAALIAQGAKVGLTPFTSLLKETDGGDYHLRMYIGRSLGMIYAALINQGKEIDIDLDALEKNLPDQRKSFEDQSGSEILVPIYYALLDRGKITSAEVNAKFSKLSHNARSYALQVRADVTSKTEKKVIDVSALEAKLNDFRWHEDKRIEAMNDLKLIYLALIQQGKEVDLSVFEEWLHYAHNWFIRKAIAAALGPIYLALIEKGKRIDISSLENIMKGDVYEVQLAAARALGPLYGASVIRGEVSLESIDAKWKEKIEEPMSSESAAEGLGSTYAYLITRGAINGKIEADYRPIFDSLFSAAKGESRAMRIKSVLRLQELTGKRELSRHITKEHVVDAVNALLAAERYEEFKSRNWEAAHFTLLAKILSNIGRYRPELLSEQERYSTLNRVLGAAKEKLDSGFYVDEYTQQVFSALMKGDFLSVGQFLRYLRSENITDEYVIRIAGQIVSEKTIDNGQESGEFFGATDGLTQYCRTLEGGGEILESAMAVILQYYISGQGDVRKIGEDLIEFLRRSEGVQSHIASGLSLLLPLLQKFPSAWSSFIKPVIFNQTQGAFLCLQAIERIWRFGAIESEEDLLFLKKLIEDHGKLAYNLLNNFIIKGLTSGVIPKPVSSQQQSIAAFLNEVPYPIIEIYQSYKDSPEQLGELKQRCEEIRAKIVQGDSASVENYPFFEAMLMYVFPPAVTSENRQYAALYRSRQDRSEDTEKIPAELRAKGYEASTGRMSLKDPSRPPDLTKWSTILEAVRETNSQPLETMNAKEIAGIGKDLLACWRENNFRDESKKRDFLKRLYLYFRCTRGQKLPESLHTYESIMSLKEFMGDTLGHLVAECILAYRTQSEDNERDYQATINQMFQRKIENTEGKAQAIINIMKRFRNDPEAGKTAIAGALRLDDVDVLDKIWDGLQDKTTIAEIAKVLEELRFEPQPGKESFTITSKLQGNEYRAMQSEIGSKFEFHSSIKSVLLRFEVSKKKAHGVAGLNMGVCVAPDKKLWANPDFMNVIIWDDEQIAQGGMHILLITDNGKQYLVLPGINPSVSLLTRVSAAAIFGHLISYAADLARELGCDAVLVPTNASIHSNRSEIQRVIAEKNYRKIVLGQVHDFSYDPFAYSFQDCFIAAEVNNPEANLGGQNVMSDAQSDGVSVGSPAAAGLYAKAIQIHWQQSAQEALQSALIERVENTLSNPRFITDSIKAIYSDGEKRSEEKATGVRLALVADGQGRHSVVLKADILNEDRVLASFALKADKTGYTQRFRDNYKTAVGINNALRGTQGYEFIPALGAADEGQQVWSEEYIDGINLSEWREEFIAGKNITLDQRKDKQALDEEVIKAYFKFCELAHGYLLDPRPENFVVFREGGRWKVKMVDLGDFVSEPAGTKFTTWLGSLIIWSAFEIEDILTAVIKLKGKDYMQAQLDENMDDPRFMVLQEKIKNVLKNIDQDTGSSVQGQAASPISAEVISREELAVFDAQHNKISTMKTTGDFTQANLSFSLDGERLFVDFPKALNYTEVFAVKTGRMIAQEYDFDLKFFDPGTGRLEKELNTTTGFFRDRREWLRDLEGYLSDLISAKIKKGDRRIDIKAVGTSCEELYTLAIVLAKALSDKGQNADLWGLWDIQITGYDVNPILAHRIQQYRFRSSDYMLMKDDFRLAGYQFDEAMQEKEDNKIVYLEFKDNRLNQWLRVITADFSSRRTIDELSKGETNIIFMRHSAMYDKENEEALYKFIEDGAWQDKRYQGFYSYTPDPEKIRKDAKGTGRRDAAGSPVGKIDRGTEGKLNESMEYLRLDSIAHDALHYYNPVALYLQDARRSEAGLSGKAKEDFDKAMAGLDELFTRLIGFRNLDNPSVKIDVAKRAFPYFLERAEYLTGALGALLVDAGMPQELKDKIAVMLKALKDAKDVLNSYGKKGEKVTADVQLLLERLMALARENVPAGKEITIKSEPGSFAMREITADPVALGRAFFNLLINAVQAIPGKGEITVGMGLDGSGEHLTVTIRDTGIGIPKNELARIFEAGYTTKREVGGTGLGLAAVKQAIENHSGTLAVESEAGQGTAFIITLPIKEQIGISSPLVTVDQGKVVKLDKNDLESLQAILGVCFVVAGFNMARGERVMAHLAPSDHMEQTLGDAITGSGWKVMIVSSVNIAPDSLRGKYLTTQGLKAYLKTKGLSDEDFLAPHETEDVKTVLLDFKGTVEINGEAIALNSAEQTGVGSPVGGIDLRALPIVTESVSTSTGILSKPPVNPLDNLNLDEEWQKIQSMVHAGIIPSNERLKEYLESCCQENDFAQEADKVLACIADILRLEEEQLKPTEDALRQMLVLLESAKPPQEIKFALTAIITMAKEPAIIAP